MKLEDVLFGRRIRQNHALEHATFTVLASKKADFRGSARSSATGFIILADIEPELLRQSIDEALCRLQAGEAELAIHPNCGTNLAVGLSLLALGSVVGGISSSLVRTRVASLAASSLVGWAVARPVGQYVQKHFTTLADLQGVRVTDILRRQFLGFTFIEVRTIQE